MTRRFPSILEVPFVEFGREICGDPSAGLRREWLATNGLGGYASGTVNGIITRRYHGLLVAAMTPPVWRTVLVAGLVEEVTYNGRRYQLSTHEWGSGAIAPEGYVHCVSFVLDGMLPVWRFALGDALLEKRVWMMHGQNTTHLSYELLRASGPVDLSVAPLVACRDHHSLAPTAGWEPRPEVTASGFNLRLPNGWPPLRVLCDNFGMSPINEWYWDFQLREEAARGLDHRTNLYALRRSLPISPKGKTALLHSRRPVMRL